MATYHGIEHIECLKCGWSTRDDETMELLNDDDDECPTCQSGFFLYSQVDGEQVVVCTEWKLGERFSESRGWFRLREGWGK